MYGDLLICSNFGNNEQYSFVAAREFFTRISAYYIPLKIPILVVGTLCSRMNKFNIAITLLFL